MGQTDQNKNESSLGSAALSAMGWVELSASVILFVLQIYPAAVAFAVAGIFISLVANQVRRKQEAHVDHTPRNARRIFRTAIIILGWALVAAAIAFVAIYQRYLTAFVFVLWAALLALLTGRLKA
jgi:hypothetical protein